MDWRTHLSASTVRDFQTGFELALARSRGVMGLPADLGVCAPDAVDGGVMWSSSIAKISSDADAVAGSGRGGISGLRNGERWPWCAPPPPPPRVRLSLVEVVVKLCTGDNFGDFARSLYACLTLGTGISCFDNHSRCFSIKGMTANPIRGTNNFAACFCEITSLRSCRTS
jgi:hypothetical protein